MPKHRLKDSRTPPSNNCCDLGGQAPEIGLPMALVIFVPTALFVGLGLYMAIAR